MVASTEKLRAGTYYVTATAWLSVITGDAERGCWIAKGSAPGTVYNQGIENLDNAVFTIAETAAVRVTAGDTLVEVCQTGGTNGSLALDPGALAIRVLSASHR